MNRSAVTVEPNGVFTLVNEVKAMKEPASIWFADEYELRQLCGDAQSQARSESEMDFARDMMIEANYHGLSMQLSEKQLKWLCKIADWDIPRRRS